MLINTIEALQQLYVALGGDIKDVQNITITPEMISALTDVAAAAASELPAVKGADNGKVLTVVSGKWAKADAPTELPTVSNADDGDFLRVVSGKWEKSEVDIPTSDFLQGFGTYTGFANMFIPKSMYKQVKESSILDVNFTGEGVHHYFYCNGRAQNNALTFICVVRGASATTYHTFSVNASATSDTQEIAITTTTINDPASAET